MLTVNRPDLFSVTDDNLETSRDVIQTLVMKIEDELDWEDEVKLIGFLWLLLLIIHFYSRAETLLYPSVSCCSLHQTCIMEDLVHQICNKTI